MATPLHVFWNSGGDDAEVLALELRCDAWPEPLRLIAAYDHEPIILGLEDGSSAAFEPSAIDWARAKSDTSGFQRLTFAIDNVRGDAQRLIDTANEAEARITMIARTYLSSDLTAPAERPHHMTVFSAGMERTAVRIEAGFYDMLNRAWPPRNWYYTADRFPGLKH